jgi:hypothetical protein
VPLWVLLIVLWVAASFALGPFIGQMISTPDEDDRYRETRERFWRALSTPDEGE